MIKFMLPHYILTTILVFSLGTVLFWKTNNIFNLTNYLTSLIAVTITYSSIYMFNDLMDLEYDKKHYAEWKKNRPLASGEVQIKTAKKLILFSAITGILTSSLINTHLLITIILIITLNYLYSYFKLKKKPVIGISVLIATQILKILSGWLSQSTNINNSPILFLLTFAFVYGAVSIIYKKRFFKKHNHWMIFLTIISITALLSAILSLFFYKPISNSIINTIIITIPCLLIMKNIWGKKDLVKTNMFQLTILLLINIVFLNL